MPKDGKNRRSGRDEARGNDLAGALGGGGDYAWVKDLGGGRAPSSAAPAPPGGGAPPARGGVPPAPAAGPPRVRPPPLPWCWCRPGYRPAAAAILARRRSARRHRPPPATPLARRRSARGHRRGRPAGPWRPPDGQPRRSTARGTVRLIARAAGPG